MLVHANTPEGLDAIHHAAEHFKLTPTTSLGSCRRSLWQVPTRINLVQTKHSWHQTQSSGCGAGCGARSRRRGARRLTGLFSHALPGTLAVLSRPARSDKAGIVTLAGAVLAG